MNAFSRLWRARQLCRDISEEIREHLEEKIDATKKSGLSSKDAAAAARREFGNVRLLEESSREVWKWSIVENALADLRYAARQLRKSAAFAVTAILALVLGQIPPFSAR